MKWDTFIGFGIKKALESNTRFEKKNFSELVDTVYYICNKIANQNNVSELISQGHETKKEWGFKF